MVKLEAFFGSLGVEVNSFSPLLTGMEHFRALNLVRAGQADRTSETALTSAPLRRLWELESSGVVRVHQGLCASAQPGGLVGRDVYEALRDELLNDICAAGHLDIVILALHGAMVAVGYDDCEADLLSRVREVVGGDTTVAVLLDPHCHISREILRKADLAFAYKENPHDDILPVAEKLVDEAIRCARGETSPAVAAFDCRMIGTYNTFRQPMRGFVDALQNAMIADPKVIDISVAHGFPWGDVADEGTRVWVTTDGDSSLAGALAEQFGTRLIRIREQVQAPVSSIADALVAARQDGAPLILADTSDNPGGGAPGDSTQLIGALCDAGVYGIAAGIFWDPGAVALCKTAGEGARIPIRLGGKVCQFSGKPLDLDVRVHRILERAQIPFAGGRWPMGDAVAIGTPQADFILSTLRTQCFSVEAFEQMGVSLSDKHVILVKSSNHFLSSFGHLSDRVFYVETPGVLSLNFRALPYRKLHRPAWPLDPVDAGEPMPL